MIASVRGEVLVRRADHVVIESAGVGYRLTVSAETLKAVPASGKEATLHAPSNPVFTEGIHQPRCGRGLSGRTHHLFQLGPITLPALAVFARTHGRYLSQPGRASEIEAVSTRPLGLSSMSRFAEAHDRCH